MCEREENSKININTRQLLILKLQRKKILRNHVIATNAVDKGNCNH